MYYEFFRTYFAGNVDAARERMNILEKCISVEKGVREMLEELLASDNTEMLEQMGDLVKTLGDPFLRGFICKRLYDLDPSTTNKQNLADCLFVISTILADV